MQFPLLFYDFFFYEGKSEASKFNVKYNVCGASLNTSLTYNCHHSLKNKLHFTLCI